MAAYRPNFTQATGGRAGRIITALLLILASEASIAQTPELTGRVVDEAGILSSDTEDVLTGLLAEHEAATGNQVVILTVPSLRGESIEDFGLRTARAWGIGRRGRDNGVLLVVAPVERKVRIEVGFGLEGALPDAVAGRIIRNTIVPHFREEDFDGGVTAGTMAIVQALEGDHEGVAEAAEDDWLEFAIARILISIFSLGASLMGAFSVMIAPGAGRWIGFVFLMPFFIVSGYIITLSTAGAAVLLSLYIVLFLILQRRPAVRRIQQKVQEAARSGKMATVSVGGWTFNVGGGSTGSGGSSSFGGGGGSFGGGGASGSW